MTRKNHLATTCLSFLLAVAMLVGSLPLTGMEVKAAGDGTENEVQALDRKTGTDNSTANARASV